MDALNTAAQGARASSMMMVGGIATSRATRAELALLMAETCLSPARDHHALPKIIVSSNGAVIAAYHSSPAFRSLIDEADIVDVDGMPLVLATRLLSRQPLRERVATTDFINDAAEVAARSGIRFFFLGGEPEVAQRAATNLQMAHPSLQIVGARHGFFSVEEETEICAEIVRSGTDILWVGLGSPRQEQFAVNNREALRGVAWIRTCGGLFDHQAGDYRRAPAWMQKFGLEWLHRAALEPRRLGPRYLRTNPLALYHLITKTDY